MGSQSKSGAVKLQYLNQFPSRSRYQSNRLIELVNVLGPSENLKSLPLIAVGLELAF